MIRQGYDAAPKGWMTTYDGRVVVDVAKVSAQRHPRARSAYRPTTLSESIGGHTPIMDGGAVRATPCGAMPWRSQHNRALGPAQRALGQQENHHGTRTRLLFDE
jgi:hypothetical protein